MNDSTDSLQVRQADIDHQPDQRIIVDLLDMYSREPTGQGHALSDHARQQLIAGIRSQDGARIFLAILDQEPVGLAICFRGFSTFRGLPLLNVHDLAVSPRARGQGIGRELLQAVERDARDSGCCRVTLEVRADNPARRLYERFGFNLGEPEVDAHFFGSKDLL